MALDGAQIGTLRLLRYRIGAKRSSLAFLNERPMLGSRRSMSDPAVAELLIEREAKGLQVPAIARIAFGMFGTFGGASALSGIPSSATVAVILVIASAIVAINLALASC